MIRRSKRRQWFKSCWSGRISVLSYVYDDMMNVWWWESSSSSPGGAKSSEAVELDRFWSFPLFGREGHCQCGQISCSNWGLFHMCCHCDQLMEYDVRYHFHNDKPLQHPHIEKPDVIVSTESGILTITRFPWNNWMYTGLAQNPCRFQKGGSLRDSLHGANPGQNYLRKYCSPKRNQVCVFSQLSFQRTKSWVSHLLQNQLTFHTHRTNIWQALQLNDLRQLGWQILKVIYYLFHRCPYLLLHNPYNRDF